MTSENRLRIDQLTNPLVQMLGDRISSCKHQSLASLASPMRLMVSGISGETHVVDANCTVGDWLDSRYLELAWIQRCLLDAGHDEDVPTSLLRPRSRSEALTTHINKPRIPGMVWPLHYAAGLFHHTLQQVELLMWPDTEWGGYAEFLNLEPVGTIIKAEAI